MTSDSLVSLWFGSANKPPLPSADKLLAFALLAADIIFVSVNTPTKTSGIGAGKAADLSYWESAARLIANACKGAGFKVVVEKSTVPVKTAEAISKVCGRAQLGPGCMAVMIVRLRGAGPFQLVCTLSMQDCALCLAAALAQNLQHLCWSELRT